MIKLKDLLKEQPTETPQQPSGDEDTKKLKIDIPKDPFDNEDSEEKVNEGPSYEYANYMKKIEKAENIQAKEVNNLVKLLNKKGLKKQATNLASKYMKGMRDFDNFLKKLYRSLT